MKKSNYLSLLTRLWFHLSIRRRRQFLLLIPLTGISSIAEILSLGIIIPYLGVLVSPDKIINSPIAKEFIPEYGKQDIIFLLTISLIVATIISITLRITLIWANTKIAIETAGELRSKIYRKMLYQPYINHLSQNSSEIITLISSQAGGAINYLQQSSAVFSGAFILISLTFTLIAIDPITTFTAILFFGISYFFIALVVKIKIKLAGKEISKLAPHSIKALQEGLGGIRNVIIDNSQEYYCVLFDNADKKTQQANISILFMSSSPRYILEGLGVSFIVFISYAMYKEGAELDTLIPVLGALAIGAQRILPILHGVYSSWTTILSNESNVSAILTVLEKSDQPINQNILEVPIKFSSFIHLNSVNFQYPKDKSFQLKNINLKISKGEKIGIIGTSGSGKSTLIDILMGLLLPSSGEIFVDGVELTRENKISWQMNISHVPQNIFLVDATIAENIAFGESIEEIDLQKVKRAAEMARISGFIDSKINKYFTSVGERGVNLSGGQKQRLALARALYKNKSVLVLDEATSALDVKTEKEVLDAINHLDSEMTVIIISHRIESMNFCNRIYRLDEGCILHHRLI